MRWPMGLHSVRVLQFRRPALAGVIACTCTLAMSSELRAQAPGTADARALLLTGHYEEARNAYERLASREPVPAAIGIARCRSAVGEVDEAARILVGVLGGHPDAAAAWTALAELEFARGDYAATQKHVAAALSHDPDQPAGRFVEAELHRVAGRLDEANEAYLWLVRYYNREQEKIEDPETLRWIGLAAAQYARWNRNSGQFHFLVNTLYPDALKRDSTYWPGHLEAALLFIEKYNRPDAMDELNAARAINPRAADIYAARARIFLQQFDLDSARSSIDRALALNSHLVVAHRLRADVQMVTSGPREALSTLGHARALNPVDEETLGRLAAVYGAIDGLGAHQRSARMESLIAEVVRRNEHCGEFFAAMAASLDLLQKFPYAAKYYEEARRRMPQLVAVPGQLGLVTMRLGDEARAREILKEAFEIDPFNVRVKNSLEVLELLEDYGTIETQHFVTRFDRGRDSLLARYASRYLEEDVYPDVVKALGYEPPGKSLIEIFARAKGTSGQNWFSARMVGLPFLGVVGACTGKIVAIASPNDGARPFNWARVLKHEFVHVVNLQQTDFNIPRWFTEALAVRHEGGGTPRLWDQVLTRRVAADSLFNLDNINLGFVRPNSGEDWALAYCQAALYARYMEKVYGRDAPNRMIAAYASILDTRAALKRCFGITEESFESGYRTYVAETSGGGVARTAPAVHTTSLDRAAANRPRDAHMQARLARAELERGHPYQARDSAARALEIDPKDQLAAFVVARVHLLEGGAQRALEVLRGAFDPQAPQFDALALLANLTLEAKDYAEAERLIELGEERFPLAADWEAGLVVVYRETSRRDKLGELLARRVDRDPDDFDTRMKLAELALEHSDFEAAGRWAEEALHIDVMKANAHATLARAMAESHREASSVEEYETAITLEPGTLEWRLALAKVCIRTGRKERARQVLTELLQRDGQYPGARDLLGPLSPAHRGR